MKKSTQEQALSDALEPIVTELIDSNFENSKDKIALQISPLIGTAIREQIKARRDDIIEALYPILGNMISKFVAKSLEEVLNSINDQIQAGLSFKTFKRKFEAKRRGVTETQLLLEENSNSDIRAVLLIHKETGIILAEAHNPNETITEPEMIASMMTAITSFINDWIEKNESSNEVGEIDYGSSKIVVENGGFAYLAVIVNGATYNRTLKKIRSTLEDIVSSHGQEIRDFNGDLSDFSDSSVSEKMLTLIDESVDAEDEKKKTHPLIWLLPILLIFTIVWNIYQSNIKENLEIKIQTTLHENSLLTSYNINAKLIDNIVHIDGHVPFLFHKDLAEKSILKVEGVTEIKNNLVVLPTLDDPMQISSNLAHLIKGLNIDDGINITYNYNYPKCIVKGSTWDEKRKSKVIEALKGFNESTTIIEDITVTPPKIKKVFYFAKATYMLNDTQERELLELSKFLNLLDDTLTVSIKGFSDDRGSLDTQKYFAKSRAENISNILKNELYVKQNIVTSSDDNTSLYFNVTDSSDKQRSAIITIENRER